jgi:glutaredoxin
MAPRFLPPVRSSPVTPAKEPGVIQPGDRRPVSVVYTRAGCCLCDDAIEILRRHGLSPEEIDIDRDDALCKRYTDCVPVVVIDGKERFRGRVNEVLLKRLLR